MAGFISQKLIKNVKIKKYIITERQAMQLGKYALYTRGDKAC
jgi:hypothetical protein